MDQFELIFVSAYGMIGFSLLGFLAWKLTKDWVEGFVHSAEGRCVLTAFIVTLWPLIGAGWLLSKSWWLVKGPYVVARFAMTGFNDIIDSIKARLIGGRRPLPEAIVVERQEKK